MADNAQNKRKAHGDTAKAGNGRNGAGRRSNGESGSARQASESRNRKSNGDMPARRSDGRFRSPASPAWITAVIGVGVAVAAGLFATRKQWMPGSNTWSDDYSAAFADDETDFENFDQTRNAGTDSMRDHPGDDWEDIDDMSDASFPASDPPSFTPGRA